MQPRTRDGAWVGPEFKVALLCQRPWHQGSSRVKPLGDGTDGAWQRSRFTVGASPSTVDHVVASRPGEGSPDTRIGKFPRRVSMAPSSSPTVRRRRLAAELHRLRQASKLTIEQVAEQLEWSPGKVSKIENA